MLLTGPRARDLLGDGGEDGLPAGVLVDVEADVLVPGGPVVAVLVGDSLLERVVGLGLDEQVAQGVEDGGDLGRGLPVLGLEDAQADVAEGVVGHVGVVDARGEAHGRRLEGVLDGEGEQDAVLARVEGRRGRRDERDLPRVDGLVGREGDGEALWGGLRDFGVFLSGVRFFFFFCREGEKKMEAA